MSHTFRAPVLAVAAIAFFATACSRSDAATPRAPATTSTAAAAGASPQLLFFMNPNGRPCQIQDGILRDMAAELSGKVALVYYKTTHDEDLARFQEFGIRALPTLVVTDPTGRELRRGSPGIQSPEQIRQLVAP